MASLEEILHHLIVTQIIIIPPEQPIHMGTKGGQTDILKNLEEIMITILTEENVH